MTTPVVLLHGLQLILGSLSNTSPGPFPYTVPFDIQSVARQAEALPAQSWEYGTEIEVLLEVHNPELSVFGDTPFPAPALDRYQVQALSYAERTILIGQGQDALSPGAGSVGDPASLGVGAYLLGKTDEVYRTATTAQLDYVLQQAPRWENGAISHRANVPELWADFMYMVPPFIAYYGADNDDVGLLEEALWQCHAYRDVLSSANEGSNLWKHIVGPESTDHGHWSTGNGWAAAGMTRVLATILKAPVASDDLRFRAENQLTLWIKEIVDAVMAAGTDNGLTRNYVDDELTPSGFGELAGMSMIASVIYRMAVLSPHTFPGRNSAYAEWANNVLITIGGRGWGDVPYVNPDGIVAPAVNPYAWGDTDPYTIGSPEAQGMVTLAYVAYRDCVRTQVCDRINLHPQEAAIAAHRRKARKASTF